MSINELLEIVIKKNASDLHLIVGEKPTLRIDGDLAPIAATERLIAEEVQSLIFDLVTEEQKELLLVNREIDFSFALEDVARFRVNAYHQKGYLAASLRLISTKIRTIEELNLPKICHQFASLEQGFVLVTGPTGHGKSTTIAAMVQEINEARPLHILTIEDPIEYVYPPAKGIISQRELHLDTHSWEISLRSALREDPDVVLIGEMRDLETIASAITIAETGHLVFSTLHTNSASQTIDRIVDVFPEHQQEQVRAQLASTIAGVIAQRLVPAIGGGRYPAVEILMATSAVKTVIREGKTHLIDNIIQTSAEVGMIPLEVSLANLVRTGKITLDTAQQYAIRPQELLRQVKGRKES